MYFDLTVKKYAVRKDNADHDVGATLPVPVDIHGLAVSGANPHPTSGITRASTRDEPLRDSLNGRAVPRKDSLSLQRQCRLERVCEGLERDHASDVVDPGGNDELDAAQLCVNDVAFCHTTSLRGQEDSPNCLRVYQNAGGVYTPVWEIECQPMPRRGGAGQAVNKPLVCLPHNKNTAIRGGEGGKARADLTSGARSAALSQAASRPVPPGSGLFVHGRSFFEPVTTLAQF